MGRNIVPFALGAVLVILLLVPNGREMLLDVFEYIRAFLADAVDKFTDQ